MRNLIGDVRVERGTTPGIHVTATTTIEAASQAEAERLLGLIDFRTSDVGAGSRFDVRLPKEHFPKIYSEKRQRRLVDRRASSSISASASGWSATGRCAGRARGSPDPRARRREARRQQRFRRRASPSGYSGKLRLDGGSGLLSSTGRRGRARARQRQRPGRSSAAIAAGRRRHRQRLGEDHGLRMRDPRGHGLRLGRHRAGQGQRARRHRLRATSRSRALPGRSLADTGSGSVQARGLSDVRASESDTGSGSVSIEGDLSALAHVSIDTGSGAWTCARRPSRRSSSASIRAAAAWTSKRPARPCTSQGRHHRAHEGWRARGRHRHRLRQRRPRLPVEAEKGGRSPFPEKVSVPLFFF